MSAEDQDVLTPPTRVVEFRGEQLTLSPLRLEQLGPFITAARPILGHMAMMVSVDDTGDPLAVGALMLDVLENGGPAVAATLAVATDREPDLFSGASLDDVAVVIEAVVALNRDFFVRRLQMMVRAIRQAADVTSESSTPSST